MGKYSWVFGWLGLLAFILAVPMSIAANMLTPLVNSWWATTSQQRLKSRINKLEEQIQDANTAEALAQMIVHCTLAVIYLIMAAMFGGLYTLVLLYPVQLPHLAVVEIITYGVIIHLVYLFFSAVKVTFRLRPELFSADRQDLQNELRKLKSKVL